VIAKQQSHFNTVLEKRFEYRMTQARPNVDLRQRSQENPPFLQQKTEPASGGKGPAAL
jgi:hypothetical protein